MNYLEINELLSSVINELLELGYKKTVVGKLLLGSSGYAPILKYADEDEESSKPVHLGVKPLSKIGDTIGYELHLVYVKKDNTDLVNEIENINTEFFDNLKSALVSYMNKSESVGRKKYTMTKQRTNNFKFTIDAILNNEILTIDSFKEEDETKLE